MINFITKLVKIPNNFPYKREIWGTFQPLSELKKNSGVYVKVRCEGCSEINEVRYADLRYRDYYCCHKCIMKEKRGISNVKNIGNIPWNKGKGDFLSKESKASMVRKLKGRIVWNKGREGLQVAWNKGKKGIWTEDQLRNNRKKNRYSLDDYRKKHPLFCKVEDLKEDLEAGEILGRCRNSECSNSKEKGGWFVLSRGQIHERLNSIYYGNDGNYFYCSEKCKHECRLFGKSAVQLMNEDERTVGKSVLKFTYTQEEYNTYREEALRRADYKCEYCGKLATCVHHGRTQKLEPFFALDPDWGIVCCSECHYKYGHPAGTECSTGSLANIICIEEFKEGD